MCKKLEDGYAHFEKISENLIHVNVQLSEKDRVDVEQTTRSFEDMYYAIKMHESMLLEKAEHRQRQTQGPRSEPEVTQRAVKLPTVSIPPFSGDIASFPAFKSLFDELIHSNPELGDIQKFTYLRSFLQGQALSCIEAIPLSSAEEEVVASDGYFMQRSLIQEPPMMCQAAIQSGAQGHKSVTCPMCNGNHKLALCPGFIKMDPSQRYQAVKDMKLCFCCFSYSHSRNECQSTYRCKTCGSTSHHTMLHSPTRFPNSQPNPAPINSRAQNLLSENRNYNSNGNVAHVQQVSSGDHNPHVQPTVGFSQDPQNFPQFSGFSNNELVGCSDTPNNNDCNFATVLLGTAIVQVQDSVGQWHQIRAIVDSGSQLTVVSHRLAQLLQVPISSCHVQISGIGSENPLLSKGKISFEMLPHPSICESGEKSMIIDAIILPQITGNMSSTVPSDILSRFKHLRLADTSYLQPVTKVCTKIDLLLGAEYYPLLCSTNMSIIAGSPSAVPSRLGWLLMGRVNSSQGPNNITSLFVSSVDNISEQLQKFWELEEVAKKSTHLSPEEIACEEHFVKTVSRDSTGRYIVKLPFHEDKIVNLGSNRITAQKYFTSLEQRLRKNPTMEKLYNENIATYLEQDHMEVAKTQAPYLLVHFGVFSKHSVTTPCRAVFNPNIVSTTGQTLAKALMTGPKLQLDIADLMVGFRLNPVALTCDIKSMFRCVQVDKADRIYQHILWRPDPTQNPMEMEIKTVVFGLPSSPYQANRVIQQLASDEGDKYPQAAQTLREEIYVDDIVSGAASVGEAKDLRNQLISLLEAGGFTLRKWASSHPEALKDLPVEVCENPQLWCPDNTASIKVLGLQWCPLTDSFGYSVSVDHKTPTTKRQVLSIIASIYDVNGFLSPVIIFMKIFMQQIWLHKEVSWDTPLPNDLQKKWNKFMSEISLLQEIKIPRFILEGDYDSIDIIGFADASCLAFAAVVYLRIVKQDKIKIHLVRARTKVAPLKVLTIPKLELCAALLLAQVCNSLEFLLKKIKINNTYLFSDSETVLAWLKTQPHCLKPFVANRVIKILELTDPSQWRHVSSGDNCADPASRGQMPSELLNNELWFCGPPFLHRDPQEWTQPITLPESLPEMKEPAVLIGNQPQQNNLGKLLEKYSSLLKLERVVAWIYRFIDNTRKKARDRIYSCHSITELRKAREKCVEISQHVYFENDFTALKNNKPCSESVRKLSPIIDSKGVLRVGGRLKHSPLPEAAKHPLLISSQCNLAVLLVRHYHLMSMHGGPKLVQSLLQREYWILGARSLVKKIIFKCGPCFRSKAKHTQPYMADIPRSRFAQGRPFINVAVDLAGPYSLKTGPRRNSPVVKAYFAIFVCMATKAMHLELVSSLSTEAFLAALDRFIGRRGLPSYILSDNGTNLRGTHNYIQEVYAFLRQAERDIAKHLQTREIKWQFSPPLGPNFNGLAEAGVKSVKAHLKVVMSNQVLSFDEMNLTLVRIEAICNSRPLCELSSSPDDGVDVLTPGHFLIGAPLLARPEHDTSDVKMSALKRWYLLNQISRGFWTRWSKDYLNTLMQRPKWLSHRENLKVGDVVLVLGQGQLPVQRWPLGRVCEVLPGSDGVVRVVKVKTEKGELTRPVSKLARLPTQD
ncbi:hypothetical protein M8J77_002368 [Diaphorina citri]|nr:hypothetical protein M8J77_002368 [Diaphorina citri]